jgi:hypothetical protein
MLISAIKIKNIIAVEQIKYVVINVLVKIVCVVLDFSINYFNTLDVNNATSPINLLRKCYSNPSVGNTSASNV